MYFLLGVLVGFLLACVVFGVILLGFFGEEIDPGRQIEENDLTHSE